MHLCFIIISSRCGSNSITDLLPNYLPHILPHSQGLVPCNISVIIYLFFFLCRIYSSQCPGFPPQKNLSGSVHIVLMSDAPFFFSRLRLLLYQLWRRHPALQMLGERRDPGGTLRRPDEVGGRGARHLQAALPTRLPLGGLEAQVLEERLISLSLLCSSLLNSTSNLTNTANSMLHAICGWWVGGVAGAAGRGWSHSLVYRLDTGSL